RADAADSTASGGRPRRADVQPRGALRLPDPAPEGIARRIVRPLAGGGGDPRRSPEPAGVPGMRPSLRRGLPRVPELRDAPAGAVHGVRQAVAPGMAGVPVLRRRAPTGRRIAIAATARAGGGR